MTDTRRYPMLSLLVSAGLGLVVVGLAFACMHFALESVGRPLASYNGPDLTYQIAKLVGAPVLVLLVTIRALLSRGSQESGLHKTSGEEEKRVELSHF